MRRIITVALGVLAAAHSDNAAAAVPAEAHFGQARLATAGGLAAGPVLGGMTSQRWPVIVTLSSNSRHMGARAALDMHCTSGETFTAPDGWTGVPVPASGVVHAVQVIPPIPGSANASPITGGMDTLDGKLNRRRATFSGSWELQLSFTLPSGQSDSCDSGRVLFSVRL